MGARWPSVDELVEHAAACATTDEYRVACLELLAPLVGCDAALMQGGWPGAAPSRGGAHAIGYDAVEQLGSNLARYQTELRPLLIALGNDTIAVDAEVFGAARARELAISREILRPRGLETVMLVALPTGPFGRTVNLAFMRSRSTPYAERARRELRRRVPALTMCELAIAHKTARAPDLGVTLKPSEWSLVEWVSLGYSNQQIASALGLSLNTVRNRLMRLYARLGVGSRTEMLAVLGVTRTPGRAE